MTSREKGRDGLSAQNSATFSLVVICQGPNRNLELPSNDVASFGGSNGGRPQGPCPGHNAFHPRKGKPVERRGRKAMGLPPLRRWSPGCRRDGQAKSPSVPKRPVAKL